MTILELSILKAFVEEKLSLVKISEFASDREDNTVGKGENASYQHFLLFPYCFQKGFFLGSLNTGIVW